MYCFMFLSIRHIISQHRGEWERKRNIKYFVYLRFCWQDFWLCSWDRPFFPKGTSHFSTRPYRSMVDQVSPRIRPRYFDVYLICSTGIPIHLETTMEMFLDGTPSKRYIFVFYIVFYWPRETFGPKIGYTRKYHWNNICSPTCVSKHNVP